MKPSKNMFEFTANFLCLQRKIIVKKLDFALKILYLCKHLHEDTSARFNNKYSSKLDIYSCSLNRIFVSNCYNENNASKAKKRCFHARKTMFSLSRKRTTE